MTARDIHLDRILILDFGSQYTQLIARRVREIGVYCEIQPWDTDPAAIRAFHPHGVILSGSPESTTLADGPRIPQPVFGLKVPILGICYGMQALAMPRFAPTAIPPCCVTLRITSARKVRACLMCG